MEQKTFYRDTRIINGFIGFFAQFIADFAAIPVYTVTDAVYKFISISVYGNFGKIFDILIDKHGLVAFVSAEIVDKIVSAARREIIYVVTNADVRRIVYKTIKRSVTARNNYFFRTGNFSDKLYGFILRKIVIYDFVSA